MEFNVNSNSKKKRSRSIYINVSEFSFPFPLFSFLLVTNSFSKFLISSLENFILRLLGRCRVVSKRHAPRHVFCDLN